MKYLLFLLLTAAVWAQSSARPPVPTPMPTGHPPDGPATSLDIGRALALPPDTVVATFEDGRKLTAGELDSFLAAMPPSMAQAARRDRRAFVRQVALMHRLSEMAENAKLDQQNPTRDALAFNRMYILMNAQLHSVLDGIIVQPAEIQDFYSQNQEKFKQMKVKAIYIRYSANPAAEGKGAAKQLTEAEAQAKINKLRDAIVAGADFVKMVKENSEDETSAAKDGDFGTIRGTDNLPEAIRTAIFALKAGEVSQPVKQPNGFYLFRAEEVSVQPLTEVRGAIVEELKQAHFKKWMEDVGGGLNLKIQNEGYFAGGGAAAARK